MLKRIFLLSLILVFIINFSFAESYIGVNSRGELVVCSHDASIGKKNCSIFKSDDVKKDFNPIDSFYAQKLNDSSGLFWPRYLYYGFFESGISYLKPYFFDMPNYTFILIGNNVFAMDIDGNIWNCSLITKTCEELDLGLGGFKVNDSTSLIEKNVFFIEEFNNKLYIVGRDGNAGAVWQYNPQTKELVQVIKDYFASGTPSIYGNCSKAYVLFKNNYEIGFLLLETNQGGAWGYRPAKINSSGVVTYGERKRFSYSNPYQGYYINYIYPLTNGGVLDGYFTFPSEGGNTKFFVDVSEDLNSTGSRRGTEFTLNGTHISNPFNCLNKTDVTPNIKIGTLGFIDHYKYEYAIGEVKFDFFGATPQCSDYDPNKFNLFASTLDALWYSYENSSTGIKRLAACNADYFSSTIKCHVTNIDLSQDEIFYLSTQQENVFVKGQNGEVHCCSYKKGEQYINCNTIYPSTNIKNKSQDWSGTIYLPNGNNFIQVKHGKFVSLKQNADLPTDYSLDNLFYAIDSVGALWSCNMQNCNVVNKGILFKEIIRPSNYNIETNSIIAWDTGGKMWDCAIDGSGCEQITKENIYFTNIKVFQEEINIDTDCSSYHIPNSDCENNCLSGYKKIDDLCKPIRNDDVFGIFLDDGTNLFRCDTNHCIQITTNSNNISNVIASMNRGIIAIADNNKVIECIDDECRTILSKDNFKPIIVTPVTDGVFILIRDNSNTNYKELIFVEYNSLEQKIVKTGNLNYTEGIAFENNVFLTYPGAGENTGAFLFCNKNACGNEARATIRYSSKTGGLYATYFSYYWANGLLSDTPYSSSVVKYDWNPVSDSGTAIKTFYSGELKKKAHSITTPYFWSTFTSLDATFMPPVGVIGYHNAFLPEKQAWIVKYNLTDSSYFGHKLAYCTDYGCKPVAYCGNTFYKNDGSGTQSIPAKVKYGIVPANQILIEDGINTWTIIGYTIDNNNINAPGKVIMIIEEKYNYQNQDYVGVSCDYLYNNGYTIISNAQYVLPSKTGVFVITSDSNIYHCITYSYSNSYCNKIGSSTGLAVETYNTIPDDLGGMFVTKNYSGKYVPVYCNENECKELMSSTQKMAITNIIPCYQSIVPLCGDSICSQSESHETCPQDCIVCKKINETCNKSDECCSNNCFNNICKQPGFCESDYNCEGDLVCENNECVIPTPPCLDLNEPCSQNLDCCDEFCFEEKCKNIDDYHKTCINQQCVFVEGQGINECDNSVECLSHNDQPNNIISLNISQKNCDIIVEAKCEKNSNSIFNLMTINRNEIIETNINCEVEPKPQIVYSNCDLEEGTYLGQLTIPQECDICKKEAYFVVGKKNQNNFVIPDNNFLVIIIVLFCFLFLQKKHENI